MQANPSSLSSACIRELCAELGLEYSFAVLMRVLREHIPATYIACSVRDEQTGEVDYFVILNSTGITLPYHVSGDDWEAPLKKYKVLMGDTAGYLVSDTHANPDLYKNLTKSDNYHRSRIFIELFRKDHLTYHMGLRARDPDVFTEHHLHIVSWLKEPVAELLSTIAGTGKAWRHNQLSSESDNYRAMISRCPGMRQVLRQVDEVADTNAGVLILGETGVGKELVAEAIHESSRRKGRPFVKVNCGAIPETLLESEFFGFERGAFTGAFTSTKGFFEQANGGTLCLDEIGELSTQAQIKLLRVLETHEIQRIGSPKRVMLDFRLICSTNRNLEAMVKDGSFRIDLWYRLNTYIITVPSLARRPTDIPILAQYFCNSLAVTLGLDYLPEINEGILQDLRSRSWPGNVRQLRNWMERALIHTKSKGSRVLLLPLQDQVHVPKAPGDFPSLQQFGDKAPTLEEITRAHIIWALDECRGRIHGPDGAAQLLGVKPTTLRSRLDKLKIPIHKGRLRSHPLVVEIG